MPNVNMPNAAPEPNEPEPMGRKSGADAFGVLTDKIDRACTAGVLGAGITASNKTVSPLSVNAGQPLGVPAPDNNGVLTAESSRTRTEYSCADCGKVFVSEWSDEEALAEAAGLWPGVAASAMEVVCDECFRRAD